MGQNIAGLFPSSQTTTGWTSSGAAPFTNNLTSWLNSYLTNYGANKPAYPGQMTAGQTPDVGLAQQMFQSAAGAYNPQQYADIYNKYSDVANGTGPNMQSYMNAVSQKAQNEWQQNVMPSIVEKTRGYGRGSVIPESIANAGSTYYQNLAGTMAPYMMQAGQADVTNRMGGIQGMQSAAGAAAAVPTNIANAMNPWAQYMQGLSQSDLDRVYNEYVRSSMGMLPYMIQFGQPRDTQSSQTTTVDNKGKQIGSGVDLGLNILALLGGVGKTAGWWGG